MTVQGEVFGIIKAAKKGVDIAYIRGQTSLSNKSIGYALTRLRRTGWIKIRGNDRRAFYTVKRYGDPKDMRGRTKGSLEALRLHGNGVKGGLRSAVLRGQHPRPVATTELERMWGWLPLRSPELPPVSKSVSIVGGTVRPQET